MAESLFKVTTDRRDDVAVVRLRGEIDVVATRPTREAITAQLATRPAALIIDLAEVTFFGSSGLQTLLLAVEQGNVLAVPVLISGCTRPVLRVLDLTDLTNQFDLHPTLTAALNHLPQNHQRSR